MSNNMFDKRKRELAREEGRGRVEGGERKERERERKERK